MLDVEKPKKEKKDKATDAAPSKSTKAEVSIDNQEPRCLIRCTNGDDVKFSTLVFKKNYFRNYFRFLRRMF